MKELKMLHEEYQDLTVFQMLEKMVGKYREHLLFSYWQDGQIKSVCYTVFFKDVRRLAAYFDSLSLYGQRVIIDGRNTYEQITALFAVMSMGAIAVPLCFDFETEDLQQLISRLNPSLIVYDEEDEEIISGINFDAYTLACMGENSVRSILNEDGLLYQDNGQKKTNQPAMILATSGSSSQPKLVMLSHNAILPHGYRELQRSIFVLPMYHVALSLLINDMASGIPNCLSNLRQAIFDIQWYHPRDLFAVPSFIDLMLKKNRMGNLNLDGFLSITSVGAPQTPGVDEYLNSRGIFFCSLYGATETNGTVVYSTPEYYRVGSVGKIGPWNEVSISDVGEVLVRGKNVMLGYLDDVEATSEVLKDGWYHTGDIGYIDEDGFLFITGRMKNIIILSNGENISPEAVESKLASCEEIKEVIVRGEADRLLAYIWCGENWNRETEKRVRAFVMQYNKKVPPYQSIRNIVFQKEPFPKTSSGKIKRL